MTSTNQPLDRGSAIDLFSDYLDGELPAETREQFEALLAADPKLQAELAAFQRTMNSLATLGKPPTPNLAPKVERTINRRSRGRFFDGSPLPARIPFEWISFLIIVALVMLYLTLIQGGGHRVAGDAPAASSQPRRGGTTSPKWQPAASSRPAPSSRPQQISPPPK